MIKAKEIMNGHPVPTTEVARPPRTRSTTRPRLSSAATAPPAEPEGTIEQSLGHYRALLGKVADVLFQITKDGLIRSA